MALPIARELMTTASVNPSSRVFKTPMVAMMPRTSRTLGAQVPFPKRLVKPRNMRSSPRMVDAS